MAQPTRRPLYAAAGAGALLGAVTAGWIPRIRRQGRAVIAAVLAWGAAITCFGLVRWLPAALALLAVAGCAGVISAVFRSTIIQLGVPDELRGRMMGMQMAAVVGALILARLLPAFRRQAAPATHPDPVPAGESA